MIGHSFQRDRSHLKDEGASPSQIARYRATEKSDPEDYARRTVTKAQTELNSKREVNEPPREQGIRERDA